ncbi:MAG: nitrilase-related carbon-nitrogen hydrolase [Promethearchaeota archaeon]|jgi:predicted amidohydrolase/tetratricopeptide (TPR) repeat protein
MGEIETDLELIERARREEREYNWQGAAKLYEDVAKSYRDKKMIKNAADAYKKLGQTYNLASEAADTNEEYVGNIKHAINAFTKSSDLFKQIDNKSEELETKAEVLLCQGHVSNSLTFIKNSLNKARELSIEASELFSKDDDMESVARTLNRAAYSWSLLRNFSESKEEVNLFFDNAINIANKAQKISKSAGNLPLVAESLLLEALLTFSKIFLTDFKKDETNKELFKNYISKYNEYLKIFSNYQDSRLLGIIYFVAGMAYCIYASHYIEDDKNFNEYTDRGIELLEEALDLGRKTKIKFLIISSIFYLNWWSLFGRNFKYLQTRILKDLEEVASLGGIYSGLINDYRFYADFLPVFYYSNLSQRSFFTIPQRQSYAKKGIEHALKALEGFPSFSLAGWPYQMLTYSYSQLVSLTTSKEEQEKYVNFMLESAQNAYEIGERYDGGLVRAVGLSSLYRANKTLAELSLDKEHKIKYLSIAAEASKQYLEHTPEMWRGILIGRIRLALLFEEISIVKNDFQPLMESKQIFFDVIETSLEREHYSYAAVAYVYLARIEDRMGNFNSSAEYYNKVKENQLRSLKDIKYKLLKGRIKEKINYAESWNLIELAKLYHKRENHLKAKENYEKACQILRESTINNYEASYFNAWISLEEAEHLGKKEKHQEAIDQYKISNKRFGSAFELLNKIFKQSTDKLEKKRIRKLRDVAKIRSNYCNARSDLENARILGKKGDHVEAAASFSSAASKFKTICFKFKIKRERGDLEAVYYLCLAWENMELAEMSDNPQKFAKAAQLFEESSKLFGESKLKTLSLGNSSFCQALELGSKFDQSSETDLKAQLYPKIKIMLRNAASSYKKGGFRNGADWALATSTYFDAAWNLIKADENLDLKEKDKLLRIGAEILKSAAELFAKAGYENREMEILDKLDMVEKEEKVILSALNTIQEPSIVKSTIGIVAPSCPIETSQSPKISEVREYDDATTRGEEKESSKKEYKLIYKDLLKDTSKVQQREFRVGIAQIGVSSSGNIIDEFYKETTSGLLGLQEEKVDPLMNKVKSLVEEANKNRINILLFPEMAIDLNYSQMFKSISDLAKKFNMYIIPGSYHNTESKRNVSVVIGPDGICWEQYKHIPAIIHFEGKRFKEGIEVGRFPRNTIVCNTEYGRIAIVICRDFLDMDLRVELKNFEPPVDLIFNPAFTPVTADFKAAHFDARRSLYTYCFFANIGDFGDSLIFTPEKERIERTIPPKEEGLIYKDIDLFKLRSERKKWELIKKKERGFIQSTR